MDNYSTKFPKRERNQFSQLEFPPSGSDSNHTRVAQFHFPVSDIIACFFCDNKYRRRMKAKFPLLTISGMKRKPFRSREMLNSPIVICSRSSSVHARNKLNLCPDETRIISWISWTLIHPSAWIYRRLIDVEKWSPPRESS